MFQQSGFNSDRQPELELYYAPAITIIVSECSGSRGSGTSGSLGNLVEPWGILGPKLPTPPFP